MHCRFAKPNGLFEPRHTASSRAADSEQQRRSHSEAAAKGKGYEVCCPPVNSMQDMATPCCLPVCTAP